MSNFNNQYMHICAIVNFMLSWTHGRVNLHIYYHDLYSFDETSNRLVPFVNLVAAQ